MTAVHVVVLLEADWDALEHIGHRWRWIVQRWLQDDRVASVTLVHFGRLSGRAALAPRGALVEPRRSWLAGVRLLRLDVPLLARRSAVGAPRGTLRRAARALERALGTADGAPRLVVCTHPLWMPILPLLQRPAPTRLAFDADDDWRWHPEGRRLVNHIEEGYRGARWADAVTTNSTTMAHRLHAEFGVTAAVVGNGVDLSSYLEDRAGPAGLPSGPFAVYVGVIEERVNLDLVLETARRLPEIPVVMAGPASDAMAERLRRSPVTWLGLVDVDLVPGLLRRATVGLLPHHRTPRTEAMDPMKLKEYLAAGLPVISTPLPDVMVSPRVSVAVGADQFAAAVRAATTATPPVHRPDPAVVHRDWSTVASTLLDSYLEGWA